MQITISVKQLGKKRPVVAKKILEIEDLPSAPKLRHLIESVVKQQVRAFAQKQEEKPIIPLLLKEEIDHKTKTGKVGFGNIYNDNKVDEQSAIDNALLAFQDGIYCVFIDDEQIEKLEQLVTVTNTSVIAFVRLTFLAGGYW